MVYNKQTRGVAISIQTSTSHHHMTMLTFMFMQEIAYHEKEKKQQQHAPMFAEGKKMVRNARLRTKCSSTT
jgi:hypothetical protein